jgi:lysophospholipase L1-like esterase
VPDPPKISCLASISVASSNGQPTSVTFGSATTTNGSPPVAVACSAVSGAFFPVGSTTVACTATDALQRSDSCTFTVTVTPQTGRLTLTRFIAFGDSMTAGQIISEGDRLGFRTMLVDYARSYPTELLGDLIGYYVAQGPSIIVDNQGWPAETTAQGATRLPTKLGAASYQALLLMEGANDFPNIAGALANIQTMVRYAKSQGLRVFLATLPPENPFATGSCVPGAYDRGTNAALVVPYNNGLSNIAAAENVTLVDVYSAFGGVASPDLIDCDGLHPTALGYKLIADTFFNKIRLTLSAQSVPSAPSATSSSSRLTPSVAAPRRK